MLIDEAKFRRSDWINKGGKQQDAVSNYGIIDCVWAESGDDDWNYHVNHAAFASTVDGKYAGFALINNGVCLPENERWMAQFFVVRKYRRQGVARAAAIAIFDNLPGKWEIGQIPLNEAARIFWQRVIRDYTKGAFNEIYLENDVWHGALQSFDNSVSSP